MSKLIIGRLCLGLALVSCRSLSEHPSKPQAVAASRNVALQISTGSTPTYIYHWTKSVSAITNPAEYVRASVGDTRQRIDSGHAFRSKSAAQGPGFYFAAEPFSSSNYGDILIQVRVAPGQLAAWDGPLWKLDAEHPPVDAVLSAALALLEHRDKTLGKWGVVRDLSFLDLTDVQSFSFKDRPVAQANYQAFQDLDSVKTPADRLSFLNLNASLRNLLKPIMDNADPNYAGINLHVSDAWIMDALATEVSHRSEDFARLNAEKKLPKTCMGGGDGAAIADTCGTYLFGNIQDNIQDWPLWQIPFSEGAALAENLSLLAAGSKVSNYAELKINILATYRQSAPFQKISALIARLNDMSQALARNSANNWGDAAAACTIARLKMSAGTEVSAAEYFRNEPEYDLETVALTDVQLPEGLLFNKLATRGDRTIGIVLNGNKIGSKFVVANKNLLDNCD